MKIKLLTEWPTSYDIVGMYFDDLFREGFRFKGAKYGFKDNHIIGDMDNGVNVPHVMMYLYRRFGEIQGGHFKAAFSMCFDIGEMYLYVSGSYHEHVRFNLAYKTPEQHNEDFKEWSASYFKACEERCKWLLAQGKFDSCCAPHDKPISKWPKRMRMGIKKIYDAMEFPVELDADGRNKFFWEKVEVGATEKIEGEPDFGFPSREPHHLPMAYRNAQAVIKNFLRPVWVRDVYFNIQGYDMGKGREVPCHKSFNN